MSGDTHDELTKQVRDSAPLGERLIDCAARIGEMCSRVRPPRMSIPVCADDDDIFITTTIDDALRERRQLLADNAVLAKALISAERVQHHDHTFDDTVVAQRDWLNAQNALERAGLKP